MRIRKTGQDLNIFTGDIENHRQVFHQIFIGLALYRLRLYLDTEGAIRIDSNMINFAFWLYEAVYLHKKEDDIRGFPAGSSLNTLPKNPCS